MMFTIFLDSHDELSLVYSYFLNSEFSKCISVQKNGSKIDFSFSSIDIFAKFFTNLIIDIFEKDIIKQILQRNYCYFSQDEQSSILNESNSIINEDSKKRRELIYFSISDYAKFENSMNLSGFINFRLKDYLEVLEYLIDLSVNNFIVNREYQRFIKLLKEYVSNSKSQIDIVHLVYFNNQSILLDQNKNIIPLDDCISDAKYLSDISFSSNDFCLNTLLNILPYQIYIHTVSEMDPFLETLKKIFDKRISFCNSCDICFSSIDIYNF